MPAQAIQAMKDNQGNSEFAYTATGEILDLSSLQGYLLGGDGEDDNTDESQPLTRATTGMQAEEQSYYFPEDPDMPNWKPVTMRPVYLTILQLLSLSIIGICEYLLQYSVEKGKRHNRSPYLTTFTNIDHMPLLNFALWKYLPTVVAVIFGVLVQLTDAEVKRVEPYFQLSRRPKGATAANSLNVEYLTFMAVLCPIQAIKHRHWAIFISSIAAVLSFAAVPPLQSVFLDLNPDKSVRMKHPDIEKEIVVHQIWTRLLEAVYFLIFALIGVLQVMIFRRKTGLVGDPSGIAGVAAMACKSHILMDFKGLDQADTEEIHQALKKRTYILHKSSLWQGKFLKESERPQKNVKRQNPHPLFFRFVGAIPLMLYLIGMMVFIPVFLYNKNRGLQVLQNSPWFITALSVSIKMLWEVIDRDLRILQPFFMLYNRHAHSDVLTLDYTATIPGWIIYKTAKNKHYLLTFITTITLLNEVLTVCMGSLGQGGDAGGEESSMSTKISLALSELIIFTQIIGICILLYLRRKPFLPRQPGTISSVLAYIYQSHMLKDFSGMEKATTDKRRKMLAALEPKRTYGFGWFKGLIDGQWHLGIDQEELRRGYKHGESFTDGVLQSVPTNIDVY
ncbi:hypothetical protein DFH27DRAFT_484574 [Peziza echinospora]|nr:hypothetical protein DFH27DRAFT_484574 [Peziza echinospora]